MANEVDDYVLCADESTLAVAIRAIKSAPAVALDCEGENLGQKGGSLSLISLLAITPGESSEAYIIDAIRLSSDALRPLLDILESSSPLKIVFDGRNDFSEIYHKRGITMRGVLDLQLADVCSRGLRGEDEEEQMSRLSPYLYRREVNGQRTPYKLVHRLCGLDGCITEHQVPTEGLGLKPFSALDCSRYSD
jgi:exonuclease 3'-5' domain-containing protein 1